MPALNIKNLHVYYGHIHALKGIDLQVEEGEIVTLIGSNGAGKTTTLRAISGLLKTPEETSIRYNDAELTQLRAHETVERGLVHVPEGRRVFARMSVQENLTMGAYTRKNQRMVKDDLEYVLKLFPRLQERRMQLAGTLSGGEQQMLAIGRALMSSPKVLLLDEPSMGLAPVLVETIFDSIEQLNRTRGITILLVEQNAQMALQVANRAYVLETGRITMSGNAQDMLNDPKVIAAYLGL
ncbi:MAG: ABC transporter ATP-binding protein [Caldilinea sp.]|uniref:ABC transporter ATP-binding protein n=1 Tax=Caldilinea sp. TaxID=2293560 RepID=UPI002C584F62|nr:ABC transporter ATP-binding protein [Anaerolineales bacterium]HQY91155.1 ABC transporter ATP-binding protein [Caldilinea sp.]